MEKERMQESVPAVKEDVESLSIHGIPRVASTNSKYVRIFWLLLCILAVIGLSTTVFNSFSGYFRREIMIKTTFKQNHILPLPAITFCHTDYLFDLSKDVPVSQSLPKSCVYNDTVYNSNKANKLSFSVGCKMFFGTVIGEVFMFGQHVVKAFRFPDNFTFIPFRYPCFTFNANSQFLQIAEGVENGIHMLLYEAEFEKNPEGLHHYMYLDGIRDIRRGISVWLHDPKQTVPFGTGIRVSPGVQTQISIQKTIMKRLPFPYPTNCVEGGADKSSIYPGKNTMRMCFESCFHKMVYRSCGGVTPSVRSLMPRSRYPFKGNFATFFSCLNKVIKSMDYSKCKCTPHCYEEEYRLTVSRSVWPRKGQGRSFARLINKVEGEKGRNLSTDEIRNRLIMVSLYYDDFMEIIHEATPLYNLLGIVSDLGGQMGLFLGASILSLIEIAALLIEVIKRKFRARARVRDSEETSSHCDA